MTMSSNSGFVNILAPVIAQATQIDMASMAAPPLDTNMALGDTPDQSLCVDFGGNTGQGHQHRP